MTKANTKLSSKKVVVIGGGTGSFSVLQAIRDDFQDITAVVSMADDGGSTGVLRDELGTLPPGDVRQCLVALSNSSKMRDLFNYRFEEGTFGGHSVGNILLTALEKITGSFGQAVETASEVLNVNGRVVPATLENVRLKMNWPDVSVELHGERVIDAELFEHDPRQAELSLVPDAQVNPDAVEAINVADLVIIAPGDIYTSLGPTLVIDGIGKALRTSTAKKMYICNLVTKRGQTDDFTVGDHVAEIERLAGGEFLDMVVFNTYTPPEKILENYRFEGAYLVAVGGVERDIRMIGKELLGKTASRHGMEAAAVTRSLIRHDTSALRSVIKEVMRI